MRMEALYYSMVQPFYHAKNIPQSDSSRGIFVTKDPNEIGGSQFTWCWIFYVFVFVKYRKN